INRSGPAKLLTPRRLDLTFKRRSGSNRTIERSLASLSSIRLLIAPRNPIGTSDEGTATRSITNSATVAPRTECAYIQTITATIEKMKKLLDKNAVIVTTNQVFLHTANSCQVTTERASCIVKEKAVDPRI